MQVMITMTVRPAQSALKNPALVLMAMLAFPLIQPGHAEPRSERPSATRRVEFEYPNQPGKVYTPQGIRSTSGSTAVDQLRARRYVSTGRPQTTAPAVSRTVISSPAPVYPTARVTPVEVSALGTVPASAPAAAPLVLPSTTGTAAAPVRPDSAPLFDETGLALVYENEFEGLPTANGEIYSGQGMTAAHPTLPLPSLVHVVNEANGREIVVRVNDRGPFEDNAILQVTPRAAGLLGLDQAGQGRVRMRYLGTAPTAAGTPPQTASTPAQPARRQPVVWPTYPETASTPAPIRTPATPSVTAANEDYFVQVGAFSTRMNAETLQRELSDSLPVQIQSALVNGKEWFRVRVGPVGARPAAEDLRVRLVNDGLTGARIVSAD
jgi:rare lipoprotein A